MSAIEEKNMTEVDEQIWLTKNGIIKDKHFYKNLHLQNCKTMKKQANKIKQLQNQIKKYKKILSINHLELNKKSFIHKTNLQYIRIATYLNPQKLLKEIVDCKEEFYILPNGKTINSQSLRYRTFVCNLKCVLCDIEGVFLALEKKCNDNSKTYHLNLYALNNMGEEVLMTKDHIIPKSKGGADDLSNLQTMCRYCNEKKGTNILDDSEAKICNEK